jgi:hypothetical protein
MTIDDVLSRALEAEADEVSVPDDAWERLVERLAREPAAAESPPTPPRLWVGLAAALVVVVAAVVAVGRFGDERPSVRTGIPSASTSSPDVTSPRAASDAPSVAVAVTAQGTLVRVDLSNGGLERLLTSPGEFEGGYYDAIDSVAIGPDDTVLFATCCSPIAGQTFRFESAGPPTFLDYGYGPVFSADGQSLVLFDPGRVKVLELDGNLIHGIEEGGSTGNVQGVAWSPDGGMLAVDVATGPVTHEVLLVSVNARSLDEATVLQPPDGQWWSDPVFRTDGSLLVIEHDEAGATALRQVDAEGQVGDIVDLDGVQPAKLAADPTGGWVLVAPPDAGELLELSPTNEVSSVRNPTGESLVDLSW